MDTDGETTDFIYSVLLFRGDSLRERKGREGKRVTKRGGRKKRKKRGGVREREKGRR